MDLSLPDQNAVAFRVYRAINAKKAMAFFARYIKPAVLGLGACCRGELSEIRGGYRQCRPGNQMRTYFYEAIINSFEQKSNNSKEKMKKFVENSKPIWAKGKEKGCEREK